MEKIMPRKSPVKGIRPLREIEEEAILSAIKKCKGNIYQAAYALQVSPSTIYRKLKKQLDS